MKFEIDLAISSLFGKVAGRGWAKESDDTPTVWKVPSPETYKQLIDWSSWFEFNGQQCDHNAIKPYH